MNLAIAIPTCHRPGGQDWHAERYATHARFVAELGTAGGRAAGAAPGRAHPRPRLRRRRADRAARGARLRGGRRRCRSRHGAQRLRAGRRRTGHGRPRVDLRARVRRRVLERGAALDERRSRRGDRRRGAGAAARRAVRRRDGRSRQCGRDHRGLVGDPGPAWASTEPAAIPGSFPTTGRVSPAAWSGRASSVGSIELLPRPTPLPTGMAAWLETFAEPFLRRLPEAERGAVEAEVVELLRPVLCDAAGRWTADYVRLRFAANLPRRQEITLRLSNNRSQFCVICVMPAARFTAVADWTRLRRPSRTSPPTAVRIDQPTMLRSPPVWPTGRICLAAGRLARRAASSRRSVRRSSTSSARSRSSRLPQARVPRRPARIRRSAARKLPEPKLQAQIYPGRPTARRPQAGAAQRSADGVQLNFDQAEIRDVIKVILGDILKRILHRRFRRAGPGHAVHQRADVRGRSAGRARDGAARQRRDPGREQPRRLPHHAGRCRDRPLRGAAVGRQAGPGPARLRHHDRAAAQHLGHLGRPVHPAAGRLARGHPDRSGPQRDPVQRHRRPSARTSSRPWRTSTSTGWPASRSACSRCSAPMPRRSSRSCRRSSRRSTRPVPSLR